MNQDKSKPCLASASLNRTPEDDLKVRDLVSKVKNAGPDVDACPNCGALRMPGRMNRYGCGSTFVLGYKIKHESKTCLRNQLATMTAKIEKADGVFMEIHDYVSSHDECGNEPNCDDVWDIIERWRNGA